MKNKKLLFAFSAIGVAAGFWACGSGAIESPNAADGTAQSLLESQLVEDPFGFSAQINKSKELCSADVECLNEMAKANGKALEMSSSEEPVSSETVPQSSSAIAPSSSSKWQFSSMGPIGPQSSSSSTLPPVSSSSMPVGPQPVTGLGSCAPAKATVELGETMEWKFTAGDALKGNLTELMSIKYAWSFPEGTPTTSSDKTPKVKYTQSGAKTATLKVTTSSGMEEIACTPVNVNGAPITGCKCVGTKLNPDVSAGESATWNATGCKTSGANITGYTWVGATADATGLEATAPVTKKGDVVTGVSFTVANDDNSKVTITCEDAKAIDSSLPDYELKAQNTGISLPAGKVTVIMNLPASWHNNETTGTCTFQCDGTNQQITVKAGGVSGTNYSVQLKIPISSTINGYALDVELSAAATCKVGW